MFKIKGNKDVTDLILTSNIEHISHLFYSVSGVDLEQEDVCWVLNFDRRLKIFTSRK